MTFQQLTQLIVQLEGKKRNVNIAQVKEITKITLSVLANMPYSEVARLLKKYENRG